MRRAVATKEEVPPEPEQRHIPENYLELAKHVAQQVQVAAQQHEVAKEKLEDAKKQRDTVAIKIALFLGAKQTDEVGYDFDQMLVWFGPKE